MRSHHLAIMSCVSSSYFLVLNSSRPPLRHQSGVLKRETGIARNNYVV